MATAARSLPDVVWTPQPGSQMLFLACPVFEVLYEGTRGPGKTDALLMDFAQFVGKGFGPHWRGILFRQTYPQLADVIAKSKHWFPAIFPGAKFNASDSKWVFPDGEELLFRHMSRQEDYWNYHGHEYPWIGWEELTNWPTDECYVAMMSCCRSSHEGMPRRYRSTANPWGAGHSWVKSRFRIQDGSGTLPGQIIRGERGRQRTRVHGLIWENKQLLAADPEYLQTLLDIQSPNLRAAWLEGRWDIVAGGMFTDLWNCNVVIPPFVEIPRSWRLDRCLDWGDAAPYAVLWCAEADGAMPAKLKDGSELMLPKRSIVVVAELYGWNGRRNKGCGDSPREVARKVLEVEREVFAGRQVHAGPADTQIFGRVGGHTIAEEMQQCGVGWTEAVKGPGSRETGWTLMRQMLESAQSRPVEYPCLLAYETCSELNATLPTLPRDEKKPDDVDTRTEDHLADALRYRLISARNEVSTGGAWW